MKHSANIKVVVAMDSKQINAFADRVIMQLIYDRIIYAFDDQLKQYIRNMIFSKAFIAELSKTVFSSGAKVKR